MAVKVYKPTSPGRRDMTSYSFEEITKSKPEKSLTVGLKKRAGRNAHGRITVRHRGGGHKRKYRIIDFKRNKTGMPAEVLSIEYDPNRTARIALVQYEDGEKRYIIAPIGLQVGATIQSGEGSPIRPGNALKLIDLPLGTQIHNIELQPGKGGQLARSAGTSAQLMAKDHEQYAAVRLPSGEMRYIPYDCMATIGQVGNQEHGNVKLGKAGRRRHMGWRPAVRGSAMNPDQHPHGGGEGRSPIGMAAPKTPWGKVALGKRTRRNKVSNKMIISRRKKKRR